MCSHFFRSINAALLSLFCFLSSPAAADPPTPEDVNTYAALCKTGSLSTYDVSAEAGLITRRLLGGVAQLSEKELQDEFPGISAEKNRMVLIQGFQDCVYRYVERFHPRVGTESGSIVTSQLSPSIPPERRREIVFLLNHLEDFKKTMGKAKEIIPERYYDSSDSREKFPGKDPRLLDLETYNRYKAFQSPSGIPDFSNVTKSDVKIICDTFQTEIKNYNSFLSNWRTVVKLSQFQMQNQVQAICSAAGR